MATEHEPGCDRQHTARQRCNQNALVAEHGQVPPDDDARTNTAAENGGPASEARALGGQTRAAPAQSAVSDHPTAGSGVVDEIVAIREEVVVPEPARAPIADNQPGVAEAGDSGAPSALIIAAIVFAIISAVLIVILLRGGSDDESLLPLRN